MSTTKKSRRGGKVRRVPPPPRPSLPVRVTGDLLDRVDAIRPDMIPREPYIRHLIDLGLQTLEEEEG